jgi:hypothetical protein
VAKPDDKYKCGVFCFDSNNLLAITYKTVTNIEVRKIGAPDKAYTMKREYLRKEN